MSVVLMLSAVQRGKLIDQEAKMSYVGYTRPHVLYLIFLESKFSLFSELSRKTAAGL